MGKSEQRNRSQKMAAEMLARGIFHGKRRGMTFVNARAGRAHRRGVR